MVVNVDLVATTTIVVVVPIPTTAIADRSIPIVGNIDLEDSRFFDLHPLEHLTKLGLILQAKLDCRLVHIHSQLVLGTFLN